MWMLSAKVSEDIFKKQLERCCCCHYYCCCHYVQVMWMLSAKVSEDIFKKQLERLAGAVANHLQQLQQGISIIKP